MRKRQFQIACSLATFVLANAIWAHAGARENLAELEAYRSALESISEEDLQRHVDVLADDTFEGREAGSRGGQASATYVRKVIQQTGAQGGGPGGDYFQAFAAGYRNVLALFPGSDARLRGEFLLISAHYDHVGYGTYRNSYGPTGRIHNGADDNASGTAAILELIEAMARTEHAPKRSVLFALWDGEEKGLLGSRHWLNYPTVPLDGIKLVINLDMVGRLRHGRLEIGGTRTTWGLRRLLSQWTQDTDVWLDFTWKLDANSDHWPFYERNIPALIVHTGLHDDYHRPSDDAHLINAQGMRDVARFLFQSVCGLAQQESLPGFRAAGRQETSSTRRLSEQPLPPLPSRMGVSWQKNDSASEGAGKGVQLSYVAPESAAAEAAIRTGDRIISFLGEPVEDGNQLRAAVLSAPRRAHLVIERPGEAESGPQSLTKELTLEGEPVRVGMAWREDEAEPSSVIVTRIVPASPADQAGLQLGDRIYRLDAVDLSGSDAFQHQLNEAVGAVELIVERRGRLHTLTLKLPPMQPAPHLLEQSRLSP